MILFRWLGVLTVFSILAGLLAFGVIPSGMAGMAHILFGAYVTLLAISLAIGITLL